MTKQEIENKKTKIEILCSCAYSQLSEADELICELVNNGNLEKYELNKIYNIILQLRTILNI
jgi:flagellin-specific chaperone FliS